MKKERQGLSLSLPDSWTLHLAMTAVGILALLAASASSFTAPSPARVQRALVSVRAKPPMAAGAGCTAAWVGGTVVAGASGAVFVVRNLEPWYAGLRKPVWAPPNKIFAPVWTTLYAQIGLASAIVFAGSPVSRAPTAFAVYAVQAVLNLLWAPIFFGMHRLRLGFFVSLALLASAALTALEFNAASGMLPALLLLPYLCWLAFATALNYSLWRKNLS